MKLLLLLLIYVKQNWLQIRTRAWHPFLKVLSVSSASVWDNACARVWYRCVSEQVFLPYFKLATPAARSSKFLWQLATLIKRLP